MSGPLCEDPRGGGAAQAHLKEAHAGAAARVSASAGALAAAAAAAPGAQPGAAAAATEPDAEADPFNLDAIMAPPAPRRARARSTALHADAAERAACMQLACCRTSAGHCVGSKNMPRRSRTHARTHAWAPASCLHALHDTCTEQASGEPHHRAAARAQDLLRADRVRSAARAQSVRRRRAFPRQACCLRRGVRGAGPPRRRGPPGRRARPRCACVSPARSSAPRCWTAWTPRAAATGTPGRARRLTWPSRWVRAGLATPWLALTM